MRPAVAIAALGWLWHRWRSGLWKRTGCWPSKSQIGVDAFVLRTGSVSAGRKERKRKKRTKGKDGGAMVTHRGEMMVHRKFAAEAEKDKSVSSLACIRLAAWSSLSRIQLKATC